MLALVVLDVGVASGVGGAADVARVGFLARVRPDVPRQRPLSKGIQQSSSAS